MLLEKTLVVLFAVSLFTITKCFYIKDELMEPIDIARAENKNGNFVQQRVKRQALGPGGIAQPVGAIPRDQTVIVVPNSGTNSYRNVLPYNSYGSSRGGTSVVVSQGPGYSSVPRSIEILPVNPVMI